MVGTGGGDETRCRPEGTVLHEVVRRYLGFWQLARGFLQVQCEDCRASRLVAFSCKGRGWCPACLLAASTSPASTASSLPTHASLSLKARHLCARSSKCALARAVNLAVHLGGFRYPRGCLKRPK